MLKLLNREFNVEDIFPYADDMQSWQKCFADIKKRNCRGNFFISEKYLVIYISKERA